MVVFMDNNLIALTLGNSFNQSLHSVTLPKSLPRLTFGKQPERGAVAFLEGVIYGYDTYIYDIGMIYGYNIWI